MERILQRAIVVALDGSPLAERSLPFAATLATAAKATLVLTRVVPTRLFADADEIGTEIETEATAHAYLEDVGRRLDPAIRVELSVPSGPVADEILATAERRHADMIVLTTHGRSGIGRWIYGSVADAVMRGARVPVLLVPRICPQVWTGKPLRVLVPLDGSELAEEAIGPAEKLIDAFGGELILLRVVRLLPDRFTETAAYLIDDLEAETREAKAYLERVRMTLGHAGRKASTRDGVGFPETEIADAARHEQVDVIALATHGSGGLARLVLGSVATGVVELAHVPVLVTRPRALVAAEQGPPREVAERSA